MKEWKTYKLEDLLSTPVRNGLTKPSSIRGKGVKMIGMGELFANEIIRDIEMPRVPTTESELKLSSIEKGDLLFARQSLTLEGAGKCSLVKEVTEPTVFESHIIRCRVNKSLVLPEYLYYYFRSRFGRYKIECIVEQVAAAGIRGKDLIKIEIPVPDMQTQRGIVDCLSILDEKIHYNSLINDNLEQQASSLLSDWISTYPCRTYKLSDICKYANAKCETGNLTPQNYISTENMLPNKKGIVEASNIPTGKATCFKVDDILIANIRPYFQKIWKADINGGCSADVLCIRANIESHSPILYWLLHQDAFFEYVMTGAKGCKMPRGDKQHIINWSIDLPEVQYWADLATQLGSIDQQIAYNRIESINLSNLRDTLLPKLMSGEIKINEIDC